MSDPVIKSAKRPTSRPASAGASAKSSSKSRKPAAKSSRPKPTIKRAATKAKAPAPKAAPAKAAAPAKPSKTSRPAAKPAKRAATTPPRTTAKARAATPSKSVKSKPSGAKAGARKAARPQAPKARPAAKPAAKHPAPKSSARPAPQHATPRQPTRDEAAALKSFERAHKEFARGRFSEARMLFRALIEQHAGASEVTARARTYLAIADARLKSESALPRDAESLYDRGVIELNRGDYVAAQEMFERALKREPEAADVHYALAATRSRLGSVETALQSLERALTLKPLLRVRAQHDADLSALRNEPEYERLLFPASRP